MRWNDIQWTGGCGKRLRDARRMRKQSLKTVAEAACVSVAALGRWEKGTLLPSDSAVLSVARAVGVSPEYLMGMRTTEPPEWKRPMDPRENSVDEDINAIDLAWIFTYHKPDPDDISRYNKLREAAAAFAEVVVAETPPGEDQSVAVRKIREAVMTANAAVALEGRLRR